MLNLELVTLLNDQVSHELKNYLQYKLVVRIMENLHLLNLQRFFSEQADGELGHFNKFFGYLTENHENEVPIMPAPQETISLPMDGLGELYLRTEQDTTIKITNIMTLAKRLGDEKTQAWLQWALEEQVEEEDQARMFINAFILSGRDWTKVDLMYAKQ